jgi:peptidoglycan hydrolase-like protein with peptidoglycan-binding domain
MNKTTLVLLAALAATPAAAQPAMQLTYSQVLAPPGVRTVQDRLHQAGVYSGAVDGTWGPDSQSALQRFQQNNGLQVTGQLNQATLTLLNLSPEELFAAGPPAGPPAGTPPAQPRPLTQVEVRNLQARLGALGYYHGAVDGVWGPDTQDALARFQQASGIPAGRLNPQTVTAMGLDPNDLAAPAR